MRVIQANTYINTDNGHELRAEKYNKKGQMFNLEKLNDKNNGISNTIPEYILNIPDILNHRESPKCIPIYTVLNMLKTELKTLHQLL